MSDTPETYEAVERWQQGKINIFEEMARLETERDLALVQFGAAEGLGLALVKTIDALKKERDEAREAFVVATSNCVGAQQRLREMEDQRDFAMSEMQRLERERDEAREQLNRKG